MPPEEGSSRGMSPSPREGRVQYSLHIHTCRGATRAEGRSPSPHHSCVAKPTRSVRVGGFTPQCAPQFTQQRCASPRSRPAARPCTARLHAARCTLHASQYVCQPRPPPPPPPPMQSTPQFRNTMEFALHTSRITLHSMCRHGATCISVFPTWDRGPGSRVQGPGPTGGQGP